MANTLATDVRWGVKESSSPRYLAKETCTKSRRLKICFILNLAVATDRVQRLLGPLLKVIQTQERIHLGVEDNEGQGLNLRRFLWQNQSAVLR